MIVYLAIELLANRHFPIHNGYHHRQSMAGKMGKMGANRQNNHTMALPSLHTDTNTCTVEKGNINSGTRNVRYTEK